MAFHFHFHLVLRGTPPPYLQPIIVGTCSWGYPTHEISSVHALNLAEYRIIAIRSLKLDLLGSLVIVSPQSAPKNMAF